MVTQPTTGLGKRVLAFFGSDLAAGKAGRFLSGAHKRGYTLLALDSAAMAAAGRAETPYVVLDDVLSAEEMFEAHVQADECGRSWFQAARDDFTCDGCCWPELEAGTMRYFWGNATMALKLASALKTGGTREFRFFRHVRPRAQVAAGKSDTCATLWEAELPGIARPFITFEEFQLTRIFSLAKRATRRLTFRGGPQAVERAGTVRPSTGGIFLVMGGAEALRFNDLINQLSRSLPGKVCVAAAGPCAPDCEVIPWQESVPIVAGPSLPVESWMPSIALRWLSRRTPELANRFFRAYLKSRDCAAGRPWQRPLEAARSHFEYYCRYRWPRLHSHNRKFWSNVWETRRPWAVLASSVEDGRFMLIVAAARSLGIPSLGIPHGGMIGSPGHLIRPVVDHILYSTELQKAVFERTGMSAARMHACRDLVAPHEYRVARSQVFASGPKLRLLALTDTTDEGVNLVKLVGLRAQYTALKALVEPPADVADSVEVRVKTHPKFRDLPMIEAVGPELLAKLMPAASDLHAALEETDVVVAVNYYGSALIHAFQAGKPVVQFLTVHDSLVKSRLNLFDLFSPGAALARTADEFWEIVRSLLTDAGTLPSLQLKAKGFALEYLNDGLFPPITDLLTDLGVIGRSPGGCGPAQPQNR